METTGTIHNKRTREEILAWLDRARQRKIAWEKKIHERWAEEERLRKVAEDSHYYDIE
ncbi:hypothetical protein SAMN05216354_1487 [Xylanibacter ruminicola]|uniref:Uncharacterized protein n=1 Tax=Xylanibacter ruminicola TaxID=839 RepID=A0A1H5UJY5_XYLRU|nr:hypothetical protein [Xylanibacter ruminicola]SEF74711.1 hypothetical protein SAMN05216354_1487 [Xylanibacter ruminicola]